MIGVYFLFKESKLIYIGKSRHFPDRLWYHKQQLMDWDKHMFKEYPEDKVDEMEVFWITKYQPIENIRKGKRGKQKKEKQYSDYEKLTRKPKRMVLRKLTEKSIIGFGKYRNTKVSTIRPLDIANLYFSCSHINFFDDVLDRAGITPEWRIEKPGLGDYWKFGDAVWPKEMKSLREKMQYSKREKAISNLRFIDRVSNTRSHNRKFNQKP